MEPITILSAVDQVAEYLRMELRRGRLSGTMPGVNALVAELEVGHKTVKAALRILENEGLLVNQGQGSRRRIVVPEDHAPPALRVALLDFERSDRGSSLTIDLQHLLEAAGHTPFLTEKTLIELNMDPRRVARLVGKTEADAWVVFGGSRETPRNWRLRRVATAQIKKRAREVQTLIGRYATRLFFTQTGG